MDQQLKRIHFNRHGWGSSEVTELCNILLPDEEIDECVNGFYEAGFALLAATKDRLLLVDKKPLNYLNVEDMRFDMICEFDYSHRLIGAELKVTTTGNKTLHFSTWNQPRLRRLLGFVQYRISEVKRRALAQQNAQKVHLEQLNQQLQLFLALQQHQYLQQLARSDGLTGAQSLMSSPEGSVGLDGMQPAAPRRLLSAGQVGLSAMKRVVPVISAYTRLPRMSWQRRFGANPQV